MPNKPEENMLDRDNSEDSADSGLSDVEMARALVEIDRKTREAEALKEIEEVCKRKRVMLIPVIAMRGLEGTHNIEVKALD